ncbi:MAG: hypothetical protein MJ178_01160 [Treponemataceae bacterium]|nr:hypothetical protein [Treponemataceae bacterium]
MCFKCGSELKFSGVISRSDVCPSCGADVRCCRNCTYYEPGSHYDCHETVDEPVADKEKANFCGFFRLNEKAGTGTGSVSSSSAETARNAFNALFGD